ncbi:glycerol-3-phosphate 1-O-acyltransferase PlsY [uncultured Cohaesibacter sp.]|uniref:glycerol-3-phosphate 1-O-acyltransferase PlsY n=1 Tax=uncultured Cohaesibacter sp. TaxID=1002546 RepID=UPI0029315341|nr:glycerol-3-phosphate 1-O-acyltransferase PlsY [uncultured Cohaesibacter sp.]
MTDLISWNPPLSFFAAALLFGYILGSIPFGLILTRLAGKGDIRLIGSGNIGTTNVLRTGSKHLAALTLLGDLLKGAFAVVVAKELGGNWAIETANFAGLGAFLGHLFPIWLKFKGGKGVATYVGVLLGLYWPAFVVFALMWLSSAYLSRYSSLSALIASALTPFVLIGFEQWHLAQLFAILSLMLWIRHKTNIFRLLAGTEEKIGAGKDALATEKQQEDRIEDKPEP